MDNQTEQSGRSIIFKYAKYPIIFIALLIAFIIQPFTYENIDAGFKGIRINLYGTDRGVDNVTIVTGRVWYNKWTTRIIEFPTFTQNVDYSPFTVNTKDAATFTIDPKLNYRIDEGMLTNVYKRYRRPLKEIEQQFMRNSVYDAYRIAANSFTSDEVMSSRAKFEDMVEAILREKLRKDGFIYDQMTHAILPPESLTEMINAKNASIQAKLKAENEAKQAIAEATVTKAKAEGQAAAVLIQAKAEAEANKIRQESLTPMILQQQWLAKWNGQLPTYSMGGGNTPNFMIGIK